MMKFRTCFQGVPPSASSLDARALRVPPLPEHVGTRTGLHDELQPAGVLRALKGQMKRDQLGIGSMAHSDDGMVALWTRYPVFADDFGLRQILGAHISNAEADRASVLKCAINTAIKEPTDRFSPLSFQMPLTL
ncbi:hypothetical protein A0H81_12967 [Grifola frondosa]|uniref:Uncharacterized protein n=1 Tax=Grifola frondosa TaxID=5627 RepID=A0A1C7LQX8_GRIFR|nr:hypothetical protein A0H81_12967 [Grifola frondosa]